MKMVHNLPDITPILACILLGISSRVFSVCRYMCISSIILMLLLLVFSLVSSLLEHRLKR